MTLAQEIQALLDEIEQAFADAYAAVSRFLSSIPGWLGWIRDRVVDAWNLVYEKVSAFWTYINTELDREMGHPEHLSTTADSWTENVGSPVSEQVSVAEASNLSTDNEWVGDAAEAYSERLSLHKAALTAVMSRLTTGIVGVLDQVQKALELYLKVVVIALTALIGVLIAAIISIAGGPTIVVGLGAAVVGILAAITAIGMGRLGLESDCRSAKTALTLVLNDSTAFGGDRWPAGATS